MEYKKSSNSTGELSLSDYSVMYSSGVHKNYYMVVVHNTFDYTDKDFCAIGNTSMRTLSRLKDTDLLPEPAAEVVLSLVRTLNKATQVFGSQEAGVKWIKTPNAVLGGITPFQAMKNRFSAEEVMNILGRIQYGVYS